MNCPTGGVEYTSGSGVNYVCNGAAGATGAAGAAGQSVVGASEPAGVNCATGGVAYVSASGTDYVCNGAAGSAGVAGLDGATGPMGPQGPAGLDGLDGATGPMGPQGPQGLAGATGAQGPAGATGATGATGPQGATGATGSQGPTGSGMVFQGILSGSSDFGYSYVYTISSTSSEVYQTIRVIPTACNLSVKAFADTLMAGYPVTLTLRTADSTAFGPTFTSTAAVCTFTGSNSFCSSPSVSVAANTLVTLRYDNPSFGIVRLNYAISCI